MVWLYRGVIQNTFMESNVPNEYRLTLRIPIDMRDWLNEVKDQNFTSMNAEIVRSIRERMNSDQVEA